ncbi:hypothetical protein CcaverHIS002_0309800 [Cutaneotrichosporon cavernicola]|nr:hypothetical protein CcaverHIS002_0309800 [Cutaneotrichosporon cavernicola]
MLDASAYPHILDTVLAHADYTALLSLRTISRDVRDAADARLATHGDLGEWVIPIPFTTFRGPRLTINLTGFRVLNPDEAAVFPPTADALVSAAEIVVNFTALAGKDMPAGHLGLVVPMARVVFRNPTARFILVGAETVDPSILVGAETVEPLVFGYECAERQDPDQLRSSIVNVINVYGLTSWYPNYWNAEAIETLPNRIAIRTLEEYKAEIGEQQYALETTL